MEERILQRMPELFLALIVPAGACAVLAPTPLVAILALAVATTWALTLIPLALACLIVVAMKGAQPPSSPRMVRASRCRAR
jgi:hypothetical protein